MKCILGYSAAYLSVNSLLVTAYLIIHLVRSMQYILFEYVVRRTLVCDFKHGLMSKMASESKFPLLCEQGEMAALNTKECVSVCEL